MNLKQILKKQTSVKAYNKYRKLFLGYDELKNKLYINDFVKVEAKMEIQTFWISPIYWNPIDGAYIDSHPGHIAMNCGEWTSRSIAPFLRDNPDISAYSIKKVSYNDYELWQKSIEGKYDSVKEANILRKI
jgi:hypothetical protein